MKEALCQAAQLAYEVLLAAGVKRLPVDIEAMIALQPQIKLLTYTKAARLLDMSPEELLWEMPSQDAFTLRQKSGSTERFIICYQERAPLPRRRFSLAHELGHVLLAHNCEGPLQDAQVNCFAQHLLCPSPVVSQMAEMLTPIPQAWACQVFGLSPAALEQIFKTPTPAGIDLEIKNRLAHQLRQSFDPPEHGYSEPFLDPSKYISVLC